MKPNIILFFLLASAGLTGCAAAFDGNLFSKIDSPSKLSSSKLASMSLSDLSKNAQDASFIKQLSNDSSALTAVEKNLTDVMNSSSSSSADKELAAQTYIQVVAGATSVMSVVNNAISTALQLFTSSSSGLSSYSDPAVLQSTAKSLFSGMSESEISQTLTELSNLSSAYTTLYSQSGTSPSAFYGDTNKGDMQQIGAVSALASVLVDSFGGGTAGATAAATYVISGNPASPTGLNATTLSTETTAVVNAFTSGSTTSNYAYLTMFTTLSSLGK